MYTLGIYPRKYGHNSDLNHWKKWIVGLFKVALVQGQMGVHVFYGLEVVAYELNHPNYVLWQTIQDC